MCKSTCVDAFKSYRVADRQTDKLCVVTSGHVTKIAVTPCDPLPIVKNPMLHANLMALSFIEQEL